MPHFTHCVFWNNEPAAFQVLAGAHPSFEYCDVQGGVSGTGNIDMDPLFHSGESGDYCLSQQSAGQTDDSPCVNAGSDLAVNVCAMTSGGEICMSDMTTRTDHACDADIVDLGFHYSPASEPPPPLQVGIMLEMPAAYFTPGDECGLTAHTWSLTGEPVHCNMFVFLQMGDNYWFYPTWRMFGPPHFIVDYQPIHAVDEIRTIIHPFNWPFVPIGMDGLIFWGACANRELTDLESNIDTWEWGFGL